jgi:hypothetical protein
MKCAWKLLALTIAMATPLLAQISEDREGESAFERMRRQASEMIQGLHQLDDWDTHYAYQMDAIDRVYERNGWDSEADLFSLELARDVEQIPPWNVRERFDRVFGIISDRYLLDRDQEQVLQSLIFRENQALFSKHSGRIMQYAMEAIQTRVAGEPFTADQVARWVELATPVFQDSRRAMVSAADEFMGHLGPEQRELVQSDLDAANRRMDALEVMAVGWRRGEWDASDWGLEDDPIQNAHARAPADEMGGDSAGGESDGSDPAGDQPGMERPDEAGNPAAGEKAARDNRSDAAGKRGDTPPNAEDAPPPPDTNKDPKRSATNTPDDAWAKYVREFIAKYQLADDQQQKAWLFHQDARKRADAVDRRFARQTGEIDDAQDERATSRGKAIKERQDADQSRLFERMKERLEKLPTRAQRRSAAEAKTPETKAKP